ENVEQGALRIGELVNACLPRRSHAARVLHQPLIIPGEDLFPSCFPALAVFGGRETVLGDISARLFQCQGEASQFVRENGGVVSIGGGLLPPLLGALQSAIREVMITPPPWSFGSIFSTSIAASCVSVLSRINSQPECSLSQRNTAAKRSFSSNLSRSGRL